MSIETMKQTLEDYLSCEMPAGTVIGDPKWWAGKIANVLAKQEGHSNFCQNCEALARELKAIKQEQGEPVAWQERQARRMQDGVVTEWTNWYACRYRTIDEAQVEACDHIPYEWRPLYTTPYVATQRQQRKPLTDEQIEQMWERTGDYESFSRAVEAAHGIKE